jgi:hypothetical protein
MLWNDPTHVAFDPHRVAWLADDDLAVVGSGLSGRPPSPTESVQVTYPTPQQAVLEAHLDSPGLVILCDVYYPGWVLKIDGKPATIYRGNGAMRAAYVPSGTHRLVYSYAPRSFLAGGVISLVGLAALASLGVVCMRRPINHVLAPAAQPDPQDLLSSPDTI